MYGRLRFQRLADPTDDVLLERIHHLIDETPGEFLNRPALGLGELAIVQTGSRVDRHIVVLHAEQAVPRKDTPIVRVPMFLD